MSDVQMLKYFWKEKGDLSRYIRWEDIVKENKYPHVIRAWKDYLYAVVVLNALIENLDYDNEYEDEDKDE